MMVPLVRLGFVIHMAYVPSQQPLRVIWFDHINSQQIMDMRQLM